MTYVTGGRFGWSDYAFFFRRWSDAWNEASVDRFREKWALSPDDPGLKSIGRSRLRTPAQSASADAACSRAPSRLAVGALAQAARRARPRAAKSTGGGCRLLRRRSGTAPPRDAVRRPSLSRHAPVRSDQPPALSPARRRGIHRRGHRDGGVGLFTRPETFPGTYRGSGKPFLAHLVGTASVLASLRARTPVVVTGLLHAVLHARRVWQWLARHVRPQADGGPPGGGGGGRGPDRALHAAALGGTHHPGDPGTPRHADAGGAGRAPRPSRQRAGRSPGPGHPLPRGRGTPARVHAGSPARRGRDGRAPRRPALAQSLAEAFAEVAGAEIAPGLGARAAESFRIPFTSHRLRLRVALSHLIARRPWR